MAKVKTNFKKARDKFDRYESTLYRSLGRPLKRLIVDSINKGISPVAGQGRFKSYSDSYREAIRDGRFRSFSKRISPVNLRLSGELLNSIFSQTTRRALIIGFDNELADIHTNKGAGKSKTIRKMLPQNREKFSKSITLRLQKIAEAVAKRIFK